MSNNILVTGCKGQLGSEFKNIESKLAVLDLNEENKLINERKSKLSSEMRKIVKYVVKTKEI